MPMMRLGDFTTRTPFHDFICDGCGRTLGRHFYWRPGKLADTLLNDKNGRRADGRPYCHRDGLSWAGAYHQRGGMIPAIHAERVKAAELERRGYTPMRV